MTVHYEPVTKEELVRIQDVVKLCNISTFRFLKVVEDCIDKNKYRIDYEIKSFEDINKFNSIMYPKEENSTLIKKANRVRLFDRLKKLFVQK